MTLLIDNDICTGCRLCMKACPYDALEMVDRKAVPTSACTVCGSCLDTCKFNAISIEGQRIRMDVSGFKGICAFVEIEAGRPLEGSLEILGKARELAHGKREPSQDEAVTAIVLGHGLDEASDTLIAHGADRVIIVDDPRFNIFRTDYFTKAVVQIVRAGMPEILLFSATPAGRDLAPRVANRLKTGLTADCTRLSICEKDGILLQTRPAFGGNIMATIVCPDNRPQMATVRPGVMRKFGPDSTRSGTKEYVEIDLAPKDDLVRITSVTQVPEDRVNLEDARIIVAGGRGVKGPEGFRLLEDLAEVLGAQIGATRAAVEAGWISHDHQLGQTGKTVCPDLYIACGVSGSIQHMAGVMGASKIIAVNKDRHAPIADMADETYVGDLFEVIPDLMRKIRTGREQARAS